MIVKKNEVDMIDKSKVNIGLIVALIGFVFLFSSCKQKRNLPEPILEEAAQAFQKKYERNTDREDSGFVKSDNRR